MEDSPHNRLADNDSPRETERAGEDEHYTPVIIKRIDAGLRHPDDVLKRAIEEGTEQASRRPLSLLLSSIAAGAVLCFSALAVGVVWHAAEALGSRMLAQLMIALVYPLGFVVCLMSGNQLFTEHTARAVYPVLDKQCRLGAMFRVWGIVLAGNLIGCGVGAAMLAWADDVVHAGPGYAAMGQHFIAYGVGPTLASAILAGWMMALGGWLVLSTPPGFGQVAVIYIATFLIGLGGLHHSIAGSAEVLAALMTGAELDPIRTLIAVSIAIAGNLIGGSVFVALLNYGHIRRTQGE